MALTSKSLKKLRELYLDELVTFYLKDLNVPLPTEDGQIQVTAMIAGIVLDIDEMYYYVGDPHTGQFCRTIEHSAAPIVELASIETEEAMSPTGPEPLDEIH